MLTTLKKNLLKICFLAVLITSLSNLLVALSFSLLPPLLVPWYWLECSFLAAYLILLFLAGATYFYAGMQAAQLTGKASAGVAIGSLASLISSFITTAALMTYWHLSWYFLIHLLIAVLPQGPGCGLLSGEMGGKLGEQRADEAGSQVGTFSSSKLGLVRVEKKALPFLFSRIARALAVLGLFFGVISIILVLLNSDPWFAMIYGLPLLGATLLPGATAALFPSASTGTRIVALISIALGFLSVCLFFTLEPTWCNQHPSACA
jgi:hypothetical protein